MANIQLATSASAIIRRATAIATFTTATSWAPAACALESDAGAGGTVCPAIPVKVAKIQGVRKFPPQLCQALASSYVVTMRYPFNHVMFTQP